MGLIDKWNKFIEPTADRKGYYERQRQLLDAELYKDMVGTMGSAASSGPGVPFDSMAGDVTGYPYNEEVEPSGLLGGQMTRPQFNASIGAIPSYRQMSGVLQSQGMSNEAAMQREQLKRGSLSMNEMLSQQGALFDDKMAMGNAYARDATPYIESIDRYETTMDAMLNVGGLENMDGSQQLATIVNYAKMAKPGEQLTDGDIEAIMEQFGLKGTVSQLKGFVQSGGTLGTDQMRSIVNAMSSMYRTRAAQLQRENERYVDMARNRGTRADFIRQPRVYSDKQTEQRKRPPTPEEVKKQNPNIIWN